MSCPMPVDASNRTGSPAHARYRLGRDVTLVVEDDVARLVDLDRGRFYALDPGGTWLLTSALEAGPGEAVRCVALEAGVDEAKVHRDWESLLGRLRTAGLVVEASPPRMPGRLRIGLLLTLAWISLRVRGWAQTVRRWGAGRGEPIDWHEDLRPLVCRLDQAIRSAAASHPLNAQCKERAVVAWHLLRNCWGLPAELVVGILAFPFQAHAWVECGPVLVTDEPDRCAMFTPAARYR
jgi:hypothetical protein